MVLNKLKQGVSLKRHHLLTLPLALSMTITARAAVHNKQYNCGKFGEGGSANYMIQVDRVDNGGTFVYIGTQGAREIFEMRATACLPGQSLYVGNQFEVQFKLGPNMKTQILLTQSRIRLTHTCSLL